MLLMLFLVIIPSLLLFFTPEPGKAVILQQCPIFSLIKQQRAVFLKGTGAGLASTPGSSRPNLNPGPQHAEE